MKKETNMLATNFTRQNLEARNLSNVLEVAQMIYESKISELALMPEPEYDYKYIIPRGKEILAHFNLSRQDDLILRQFLFACATGWDLPYIQKLNFDDLSNANLIQFSRSQKYHPVDFTNESCGAGEIFHDVRKMSIEEFDKELQRIVCEQDLDIEPYFGLAKKVFLYQAIIHEKLNFERVAEAIMMPQLYPHPYGDRYDDGDDLTHEDDDTLSEALNNIN